MKSVKVGDVFEAKEIFFKDYGVPKQCKEYLVDDVYYTDIGEVVSISSLENETFSANAVSMSGDIDIEKYFKRLGRTTEIKPTLELHVDSKERQEDGRFKYRVNIINREKEESMLLNVICSQVNEKDDYKRIFSEAIEYYNNFDYNDLDVLVNIDTKTGVWEQ